MSPFETVLRHLLSTGHRARFRASGDSMYPTVRDGDTVEIEPCSPGTLRRGQVILASTARGLTLHRIVAVSSEGIMMRGDNSLIKEGLISHGDVLGRATNLKEITTFWRTLDASMKIICAVRAFVRGLSALFHQPVQH